MEFKDTIEMMNSEDYKEHFKAEYYQTKIRYDKLKAMLEKWDNGELEFIPTCERVVYNDQVYFMRQYLDILEFRAKIEGIIF